MQEEWRSVIGYDGLYEVSNAGQVRSLPRPGCFHQELHVLVPFRYTNRDEYAYLRVNLSRHNKVRTRPVHQLVLEAFVGPRPEGFEAGHENGIYTDNRLSNLSWITKIENAADRTRHGTQLIGQKHHQAKLTNDQVIAIYHSLLPTSLLVKEFQVSASTIRNIRSGYNWSGVTQCHAKTVTG